MTAPQKGSDGWRTGKGQTGIDGNKDGNFTKRNAGDPWNVDPFTAGKGAGSARSKFDSIAGSRRGGVGIDGTEGDDILREVPIYEETSESPNKSFGTGTARAGRASDGSYDIFDQVVENSFENEGPYDGRTGPVREVKGR